MQTQRVATSHSCFSPPPRLDITTLPLHQSKSVCSKTLLDQLEKPRLPQALTVVDAFDCHTMADLLAGLFELVSTGVLLATKPLLLFKSTCIFGIRSLCIVIQTWIELLRTSINVHVTIICKLVVWSISVLSLPLRLLTALRRERQLEMHLNDMRTALEDLAWGSKKLKEQLQVAIKEHQMMEVMLAELEVEHEEALFKIQQLEGQVQDLTEENRRLKETQGKFLSDKIGLLGNEVRNKYTRREGVKRPNEVSEALKAELEVWESSNYMYTPNVISMDSGASIVVGKTRDVAFSRCLFSALLSLVVGIIVWEAEDACMPLVVALFAVVLMSLKSVVGFFSIIKNTPAMDAIALLSFNWFILGALTYPVLPKVADLLAPLALKLLGIAFGSLD